jgi:hypothetical protein
VAEGYDIGETFDLFLEQTDQLAHSRLLASGGLGTEFHVDFNQGEPSTFGVHRPDRTELGAFLLTLRHFVASGSPIEFSRVQRLYREHVRSDALRAQAEADAREYRQACRSGPIAFKLNDQELRPDRVLDLWINGEFFHLDRGNVEPSRHWGRLVWH